MNELSVPLLMGAGRVVLPVLVGARGAGGDAADASGGSGGKGGRGNKLGGPADAKVGAAMSPGSAATATPWWPAFITRLQISTGMPPPVSFFIGVESSLPSQTPVTRWPV